MKKKNEKEKKKEKKNIRYFFLGVEIKKNFKIFYL